MLLLQTSCLLQLWVRVHLHACVIRRAVHAAQFIDFHRDMTQAPLHLFTPFLNLPRRAHTQTHPPPPPCHRHYSPSSEPQHPSHGGLCCGAAGERHLTNEFLLTSLSPLKNLFVLLQQRAALPCSCLCSQTQALVIYTCAVSLATCNRETDPVSPYLLFWVGSCSRMLMDNNFQFSPWRPC